MARTSRETWAKRVEQWKDSGLSGPEFAQELGISAHSLSWWKWRLRADARKAASPEAMKRRPRRRRAAKIASPITFVEMPSPALRESLEVVLLTGVRIRVPSEFDAGAVARLVEALGERR
jgi:hypothetical protein